MAKRIELGDLAVDVVTKFSRPGDGRLQLFDRLKEVKMAKRLKKEEAGDVAGRAHNLTEQKKDIKEAAVEISRINTKISVLQEKRAEIKADKIKKHDIKMADFNTVLRWYLLEDDDRNATIDNIRLCAEALGVGTQGELFPSDEAVAKA